jgi:hypothetical protein
MSIRGGSADTSHNHCEPRRFAFFSLMNVFLGRIWRSSENGAYILFYFGHRNGPES